MVSIDKAKADYTYCTSCGVSWREHDIFDIVLDNMKFRVCEDCLKELKGLLDDLFKTSD